MSALSAQVQEPARAASAKTGSGVARQRDSIRRQAGGSECRSNEPCWFWAPWTLSDRPLTPVVAPFETGEQQPVNPGPDAAIPTEQARKENADPACEAMDRDRARQLAEQAAQREGVQPELVLAVMERESGFRPCAVSSKGAQGLMQLMPDTAGDLGVSDAFDPEQSISGGTKFLKQMLDRYQGDLKLALSAYNAGPGRVDRDGGVPRIPETENYVRDILKKLEKQQ